MAKLSLSDFEKYQSAALVEQASDWVHSGRVSGLQEVERHFWVAKVQEEEVQYETEVILTPSKISAYACECWTSPRKRMCVHIIASLLLIRRFLQQKTIENWKKSEEKKQEPPALAKIQLNTVLDRVDPALLKEFIRDYARKNPDFGIALKTRFADVVDELPNPFLGVLSALLPKQKVPLKPAQHRVLVRTVNFLSVRMEEAKNENDFSTSYKIASAFLTTLIPWISVLEEPVRGQLVQCCKNAFSLFDFVRTQPTFAPALKETIWKELFALLKEHPLPKELRRFILVPFSSWIKVEPKRKKELPVWAADDLSFPATLALLHLLVAAQQGDFSGIERLAHRLVSTVSEGLSAQEAVLELYHAGFLEASDRLAEALIHLRLSAGQTAEFRRIRMSIAEKTGNVAAQIVLLEPDFTASGSPELLQQIKELAGETWGGVLERLLMAAQADKNNARVCQLLDYSAQGERLYEWHQQYPDLERLLAYSKSLSDAQLAPLALPPLVEHLNSYFGRPGAVFVRDALAIWLQQGRRNMVRQLIQQLIHAFPDRTGLKETLEELFVFGLVK
jgi:hypothetical protein